MQAMESGTKIRLVIVEDHQILREGLRLILSREKGFEVVGEAGNGIQAIDVIGKLEPDIALLDISMPDMGGIDVLPILREKSPATRILMLTATSGDSTIIRALKSGARGYLSKNTSSGGLIKAIKVVHNGDLWIERKLLRRIFAENDPIDLDQIISQKKPKNNLTSREQEILSFLSKGQTNKEIARNLFISENTVKSHLHRIFAKLDVNHRLEAILYALKNGLA